MRQLYTTLLLLFASLGCVAQVTFIEGQLKYEINEDGKTVSVRARDKYISGDIVIPDSVTYEGVTYEVTRIVGGAFNGCSFIDSVVIPNCVTEIDSSAFNDCRSLTSVNIPDSIKVIKNSAFFRCINLTFVNIPDGVTSIEACAFQYCSSLTSVNVPKGVNAIEQYAFYGCHSLTSVNILDGVTIIDQSVFDGCTNLTSINIPASVSLIGNQAFAGCYNLKTVECAATTPPRLPDDAFNNNTYTSAKLYVPKESADAYKTAKGWKNFLNILPLENMGDEVTACATPTISYGDGRLRIESETEGAAYHYTVTSTDMTAGTAVSESGDVALTACYDIEAYATAVGHTQSEKATARLYWLDAATTTDNINTVARRGVVVTATGGIVTISGLTDGETVTFCTTDGAVEGQERAAAGHVSHATTATVVIAKFGKEAITIAVR